MSTPPAILIVSRHFAPSAAVGAKRFSCLAPELSKRGYETHVVTDVDARPSVDWSLPMAGSVHRCGPTVRLPIEPSRPGARYVNRIAKTLLAPLDLDAFWIGPAARLGVGVAARAGTGVIIATAPPFSAALAGARIAARCRWPLVLDYRDPYSAYPRTHRLRSPAVRLIASHIERRCVRQSVARVFNTPEMRVAFEGQFSHLSREAHFVIPNGLAAADLALAAAADPPTIVPSIVYAGAIYGDKSPRPLLRALQELGSLEPRYAGVRLVVYGEVPREELARLGQEGLAHLLDLRPRVSREELWPVLRGAAVLLAIVGRQMDYSIPYKLYDYMAAGRPILALAPPGSALERLFSESHIGAIADPADHRAIVRALRSQLDPGSAGADPAIVQRHSWDRLAEDYVRVIEYAVSRAPEGQVSRRSVDLAGNLFHLGGRV
jgi:glycosyltransferase involved in cell wall biosynthesis